MSDLPPPDRSAPVAPDAAPTPRLRRDLLRWMTLGAAGTQAPWLLAACTSADAAADAAADPSGGKCPVPAPETAGPFPADGTRASGRSLNALALAGFVRSDIRTSVGGATGTAAGVPLTLKLRVVNAQAACAPLAGHAVYVWQCTADGLYSMYSDGATGENFLRGVQVADAQGELSFTTVFPGCYPGRWPHVHFEVYRSAAVATGLPAGDWQLVSQLALPESACRMVYAQPGYGDSLRYLNRLSLASDMVFRDGHATQLATVTGDLTRGLTATLTIGLAG